MFREHVRTICIHLGINYLSGEMRGVHVGNAGEEVELAEVSAGFIFDFSGIN